MNFGLATEQLRSEDIDARFLVVTDDIASAPADDITQAPRHRRGLHRIPLCQCRCRRGCHTRRCRAGGPKTNDATRTLGVAFDGCTLPGADRPLFTVRAGHHGIGSGHPRRARGVQPRHADRRRPGQRCLSTASSLKQPSGATDRVAVVLNGLGRTKYEELFVVWKTVAGRLAAAGLTVVQPEVGELVTSLDMAGCSLTVTWLDEELERLWCSPADTPAYRKGQIAEPQPHCANAVILPHATPLRRPHS